MPLSREQEQELFRSWHATHDARPRAQLVQAHLWLVSTVAREYRCRPGEREDLLAEGHVALLIALERFDETRGHRFASYARFWVRSAMSAYLMRTGDAFGSLNRARHRTRLRRELRATLAWPGGPGARAEALEQLLARSEVHVTSLDAPVSGSSGKTLLDLLAQPDCAPVPAALEERDWGRLARHLTPTLAALDAREQLIFRGRFGLEDDRKMTLEELAVRLDLSRERVRQLEARLRYKLVRVVDDRRDEPPPGARRS